MKMALTSVLTCCAAFAAGMLLGRQFSNNGSVGPEPVEAPGGDASSLSTPRVDARSFDEVLRSEPERVLEDLAKDPFLSLTPEEVVTLARSLDLTKERSRRLLNAVASVELRDKLWEEAIRANVGKMSLAELSKIAVHAVTKYSNSEFVPIFEAVEASGDGSQIFSTGLGEYLLASYVAFRAERGGSLKESLALLPAGGASSSLRRSVIEDWGSMGKAGFGDLEGFLSLPPSKEGGTENLASVAGSVWENASSQEKAQILDKLDQLSDIQKERVLATVGSSYVAAGDVDGVVSILGKLGSVETQELIAGQWLRHADPEAKKKFLETIHAAPNKAAFGKLAASLQKTVGEN